MRSRSAAREDDEVVVLEAVGGALGSLGGGSRSSLLAEGIGRSGAVGTTGIAEVDIVMVLADDAVDGIDAGGFVGTVRRPTKAPAENATTAIMTEAFPNPAPLPIAAPTLAGLAPAAAAPATRAPVASSPNEIVVVAPGEKAVYWRGSGEVEEVVVRSVRYTPQGIVYDLDPRVPGTRWSVGIQAVQPIPGESRMARFDAMTGDCVPAGESGAL